MDTNTGESPRHQSQSQKLENSPSEEEMGHWTLTGVEPRDYDDDDDFSQTNSNITVKIPKNTAIIFTVTLHGWISLHKMFNVSSLLLDNALKPTTPLINCAVNETL